MDYARIIITGASSGFGEAFAREAAQAARGQCEIVLVARRRERLESLAAELTASNPKVCTRVLPCDLASPQARAELLRELAALPPRRSLLINNAGLGDYGEFMTAEPQRNNELMQVNMLALVELTRELLPQLVKTGGDIINIASLAADVFLPDFALYAASKAFVASFSEGLRLELRGQKVRVLVVCPGPVHTEFGSVAQRPGHDTGDMPLKKWFYTPIPVVVKGALRALHKGRARYYPSAKIWLSGCLLHILPLWALRLILCTRPRKVAQTPNQA